MTTQELNRDIKMLARKHEKAMTNSRAGVIGDDEYYIITDQVKKEADRLYMADTEFKYMNRNSILILLRLNVIHRFAPIHTFGININLSNLI